MPNRFLSSMVIRVNNKTDTVHKTFVFVKQTPNFYSMEVIMVDSLYRENNETGRIIIDISLDNYMDFFHEWDSAILRKRDMHPELTDFLDVCSVDIPLNKKIQIHFLIENVKRDPIGEKGIVESYTNYYKFLAKMEKHKIRRNLKFALLFLLIALVIIFAHTMLLKSVPQGVWSEVFMEGLMIGGWVFMWEALHTVSFGNLDLITRYREINRFFTAVITFSYK